MIEAGSRWGRKDLEGALGYPDAEVDSSFSSATPGW
jgi:hypothetical protein